MQFFLIDVGATLAVLLGYRAFVAYERHREQTVTLGRRARSRSRAEPATTSSAHPSRG
jgi:predicted membrane chloride channel (bestrophin family)